MLAEMCHIRAASPGGPRYDEHQPEDERNGEENLLLLCPTHHSLVDQIPDEYPVDWLVSIKRQHEQWVLERLNKEVSVLNVNQATDLARQVGEKSVDFAIIVALEKEFTAIKRYFPELKRATNNTDLRTYYTAIIPTALGGSYRIVVTLMHSMGNLDAANSAADLIREWSPRFVLINGIAGGLNREEQNFGDVVVSDHVVYYELGKVHKSGIEYRNRQFQSDRTLLDGMLNLRDTQWKHRLPDRPYGNELPQIYFGPIASGDKVIASADAADQLRSI
ncbi:MAG: HNH endonuclease, partial [Bacteroidota bacterium]